MSANRKQSPDNPYKVLYWMGAGILLLMVGVVALVMLRPSQPKVPPVYERTLLWLYDGQNPTGPGVGAIIEESRQDRRLAAVTFVTPQSARTLLTAQGKAKQVQAEVARLSERTIHNRLFLPYQVVEVLIQGFGYVEVDGRRLDGAQAVQWVQADPNLAPDRALAVMLAISDAAAERQPNMGVREGLALARQIETNLDLMKLPEVLSRWGEYGTPTISRLRDLNPEHIGDRLSPDPPDTTPAKR